MTTKLMITVGVPGSGKTTWATMYQKYMDPDCVLVGRDDMREKFFGKHGVLSPQEEKAITEMQERVVNIALAHGRNVIVHDMNLREKYRSRWLQQANQVGAQYQQIDFTETDVEACVRRDLERGRKVGEALIRDLHKRFVKPLKGKTMPYPVVPSQVRRPVPDRPDLPPAVIVDIDGTLARIPEGGRSPYDMTRVSQDELHVGVVDFIRGQFYELDTPVRVIYMSGRTMDAYEDTKAWLKRYVTDGLGVPYLYMRAVGDTRRDDEVKYELFNKHVRDRYNVIGVFDDRNQVVKMWREIGLTCFQVADGDF